MINQNDYPKPYSERFLTEYNIKPREVYCPNCSYTATTDLPAPKCDKCHGKLITRIALNDIMVR